MTATEKLKDILNISIPIVQAPIGNTVTPELVASVSNTGAFGGIPLSWASQEEATEIIKIIQSKTRHPFYANFVLNFEPVALQIALGLGIKTIQFSWGMPTQKMINSIKKVNGIIGIQVTSKESAKQAIDLEADYLVCQGIEAGGHVQSSRGLSEILETVVEISRQIPVLASGGIADVNTMKTYMDLGAAGVVMGSRFVATKESGAHSTYKNRLVTANAEDTIYTTCMNKGWDAAAHRILRNDTTEMWEAVGCPIIGERPGEFDVIASRVNGESVERYHSDAPLQGMTGNVKEMSNYAGYSVNAIHDIRSARDIIHQIWNAYNS